MKLINGQTIIGIDWGHIEATSLVVLKRRDDDIKIIAVKSIGKGVSLPDLETGLKELQKRYGDVAVGASKDNPFVIQYLLERGFDVQT